MNQNLAVTFEQLPTLTLEQLLASLIALNQSMKPAANPNSPSDPQHGLQFALSCNQQGILGQIDSIISRCGEVPEDSLNSLNSLEILRQCSEFLQHMLGYLGIDVKEQLRSMENLQKLLDHPDETIQSNILFARLMVSQF